MAKTGGSARKNFSDFESFLVIFHTKREAGVSLFALFSLSGSSDRICDAGGLAAGVAVLFPATLIENWPRWALAGHFWQRSLESAEGGREIRLRYDPEKRANAAKTRSLVPWWGPLWGLV